MTDLATPDHRRDSSDFYPLERGPSHLVSGLFEPPEANRWACHQATTAAAGFVRRLRQSALVSKSQVWNRLRRRHWKLAGSTEGQNKMTSNDATDLPISTRIPTFDHITLVPQLPNALNDPPGAPWDSGTRSTSARLGSRMLVTGPEVVMLFRGEVDNDPDNQQAVFLWKTPTADFAGWQQAAWTPIDIGNGRKDVLIAESDLGPEVAGYHTGFDIAVFSYGDTHFLHQPDHYAPNEDRLLIYYKQKERSFTWAGKTEPFRSKGKDLGEWNFDGKTTTFTIGSPATDRVCSVPEALEVREIREGADPVDRRLVHRDLGDPRGITARSYLFGWDAETETTTVTYPHPDFSGKAIRDKGKHRLRVRRRQTTLVCVSETRMKRDPVTGAFASIEVPRFKGPVINRDSNSPGGNLSTESGAESLGASAVWQDSDGQIWMISADANRQNPSNAGDPPDPATDGQGLAVRKALNPDGTEFGPPVRVVNWTNHPDAFAFGHRVQCAAFSEDGYVYITSSGGNTRHPSGQWSNDYPTSVMMYRCSLASGTDAQDPSNWNPPDSGLVSFMRGPISSPAGGGIWGPSIYKVGGTYYASSEHVGALPSKRTDDPDYDVNDYSNNLTDWQLDLLRDDEYGGTRDRAVIERSKSFDGDLLTVSATFAFDTLRGSCMGKTSGDMPQKHDWWVEVSPNGQLVLTYITPKSGPILIRSEPDAIKADGSVYQVTVSLRNEPKKGDGPSLRLYLGDALIGASNEKAINPKPNKDDIQFGSRKDKLQGIRGRMLYAAVYADWVNGKQAVKDQGKANGKSEHDLVRQYPLASGAKPKKALDNIAGKGADLVLGGEAYFDDKAGAVRFDGGYLEYNEEITSNSLSFISDMQSLAAAWQNPGILDGEYFLQNVETGRYLTCAQTSGATPMVTSKIPGPDGVWTLVRSQEFVELRRDGLNLSATSRHDSNARPQLAKAAPLAQQQFFLISKTHPDGGRSWVFANRDSSLRLRASREDGRALLGYSDEQDPLERWELVLA